MKSADYWKKRFELLEQSQHRKGAEAYADIEKQYRKAQRQIEGQIRAWYQRFADNNQITYAEARKLLTNQELAELKWDVQEYIRYGEENAINGQWVKELENASAKFHISRLEALKLQTQQSLEVMFGNQLDTLDSAMRDVFMSGYYRTAFEVQRGCGVGWDFATLDDKTIVRVIKKPWAADGSNFSQRVWGNRQKLVNELNQTLTQNIVLGQDPQKAIDAIAKKLNTSKTNAGRLVMTEEAYFSSEAQRECFKELDVEEYEIVATLDSHTSEICQNMDGRHFPMSQWEVGETAPPFHVWCRTTTVPYFADDFGSVGERAARMADGEPTYLVPADMTYKKWKQSFLGGGVKSGLKPFEKDDIIVKGNASTIKEAENELKKYVKTGGNVSLRGITEIDAANEMTGTINHLFDAYDCKPLEEIKTNGRLKKALARANYKSIEVKTNYLNDPKDAFRASVTNWKSSRNDLLHRYEENLTKWEGELGKGRFNETFLKKEVRGLKKEIKRLKEDLKYSRFSVDYEGLEIRSSITHEFGHVIADQKCGQINKKRANPLFSYSSDNELWKKCRLIEDTFDKAKSNGDIYNISKYASTDAEEFFAECFTIYDLKQESLPEYISEMIKVVIE